MAAGMGIASFASSIAGGWMSAIGGIAKAQEEKNQLDQQAEYERYQALINDRRAADAQNAGEIEAERRAKQIAVDVGGNRAAFAGNGLLIGTDGTSALVEDATLEEGWQDIGIIKQNAANQVWGFQTNAVMQRTSANEMNRQGKKMVKGAKVQAIAAIGTGQGVNYGAGAGALQSMQKTTPDSSAASYQSSGVSGNKSSYSVSGWRDGSYTYGSKYN
jgi:hypothetical protein